MREAIARRVTPFQIWFIATVVWFAIEGYGYATRPPSRPFTASDWTWLLLDFIGLPLAGWGIWKLYVFNHPRPASATPPVPSAVNPLNWKHEHQVAWIIAFMVGAVAGLLYGFSHSQYGSVGAGQGVHFLFWFQHPEFYWHWVSFGAVLAALAFYLARLLRA